MGKIVYAEDDEIAAGVASEALVDAGHAVAHFSNGRDALVALKYQQPDLVILDCNMPVLCGIETLRLIRNEPGLFHLPVLMLTARGDRSDEAIARYQGANEYMSKPCDPDRLVVHAEALMHEPRIRAASVTFDQDGRRV